MRVRAWNKVVYLVCVGSPFYHNVLDGRQASALGPGLDRVIAHRSTSFSVFTSAVGGDASLDVSVQGHLRSFITLSLSLSLSPL